MANNKFNYLNEKCLVCNENFKDDDDIVVCPECGTPHHRECYKENTKCVNQEKHSEEFRWEPTFVTPEESNDTTEKDVNPSFDRNFNNEQMPTIMPFSPIQANFIDTFPKEFEDGVKTEDVTVFVRYNFPGYLKKFQKIEEGKLSWNWAAFFFAPYWFFYRKLHKLGVIFLAVFVLLSSMNLLPPVVELLEVFQEYETQMEELVATEDTKSAEELSAEITSLYETTFKKIYANKAGLIISAVQSTANLIISIFIGLNANKWYYKYTMSQVKKISSDPPEEKREKLFTLGGTAYGAAFLALLAEKALFLMLEMLLPTLMK